MAGENLVDNLMEGHQLLVESGVKSEALEIGERIKALTDGVMKRLR